MADPKDLQEAADAIRAIRVLAAVQRHKELEEPLRQAEEWARKEYRKVREENGPGWGQHAKRTAPLKSSQVAPSGRERVHGEFPIRP